jgi:hypothetical protein
MGGSFVTQRLSICGLEYRVVYASSDDVPELIENDGHTSCSTNTIYIRTNLSSSRKRDTLLHEILHAFLEASGIDHFLGHALKGDPKEYERFEETLIRLVVPSILRLVEENGAALLDIPATVKAGSKSARVKSRNKKARTR